MVVVSLWVQPSTRFGERLQPGDLMGWQRVEVLLHDHLDGEPYMSGLSVEAPVYVAAAP